MDFLDFLDVFFLFSSRKGDGKKRKESNSTFLAIKIVVLLGAIAWCAYEIMQVVELSKPLLFVLFFSGFAFVLTILILATVWKLDWIEYITVRTFLFYLVPTTLILFSSASFINRYYSCERIIEVVVSTNTSNDSITLQSIADEKFKLVVSKEDYPDLRLGDSIQLNYSEGLLGFDSMQVVVPEFSDRED